MNGWHPPATGMDSSTWQSPQAMAAFLKTGTPSAVIRGFCGQFVEFEFALGDPSLALEMIMPPKIFEEFCRREAALVSAPIEALQRLRASGQIDPDFKISPIAFSQGPN